MAKHTNKIWRTVVFSGAMLVTPLAVGCSSKKAEPTTPAQPANDTTATPVDNTKAAEDQAAKDQADKDAAAAEEQRLVAEKEAADKKAADELAAKEAADKAAADAAAAKKPRPRTTTKSRPTGRGFILS